MPVYVSSLHQWTDVKDEWGHKAVPSCKLKYLIVNILWHCTNILLYIKILTIDWQIKGIQYTFKKLGLATFWEGGGVATFGGPLPTGLTSGHKKLTLFSGGVATFGGGLLLSELYGTWLTLGIRALRLWIKMDVLITYHGFARRSPCVVPSWDKISSSPQVNNLEELLYVLMIWTFQGK